MGSFTIVVITILLMALAYNVGYNKSKISDKIYFRKRVGEIMTQYGDSPNEGQSQLILENLFDYLNDYVDGND